MITSNSFGHTGAIVVEIAYPNTIARQVATVRNQDEADRLVRHHNRKYMVDRLQSWLRQRKEAVKHSPDASKIMLIAQLQVLLGYHQHASLKSLCAAIAKHAEYFEKVSPSESSRFYGHYTTVIQPILAYCRNAN